MEIKDSEFNIKVDIEKEILEAFIKAIMEDRSQNNEIIKLLKDIKELLGAEK